MKGHVAPCDFSIWLGTVRPHKVTLRARSIGGAATITYDGKAAQIGEARQEISFSACAGDKAMDSLKVRAWR